MSCSTQCIRKQNRRTATTKAEVYVKVFGVCVKRNIMYKPKVMEVGSVYTPTPIPKLHERQESHCVTLPGLELHL